MHNGFKIIACTPVGRRKYLAIQAEYILRNRNIVDEWHLWFNTNNSEDIRYIESLQSQYPNWISIIRRPNQQGIGGGAGVQPFYDYCNESKTIYLKIDDDVVFMAPGAIENLVDCKLRNPNSLIVFANTINNALSTHILQRIGAVPITNGIVSFDSCCDTGWRNPHFAEWLHRYFLEHVNRLKQFVHPDWLLFHYERFSINCIVWLGEDFKRYVSPTTDDEMYLSVIKPRELGRPNVICGNSIVSHFAFYTQRAHLDSTNVLDGYRKLASVVVADDLRTSPIKRGILF